MQLCWPHAAGVNQPGSSIKPGQWHVRVSPLTQHQLLLILGDTWLLLKQRLCWLGYWEGRKKEGETGKKAKAWPNVLFSFLFVYYLVSFSKSCVSVCRGGRLSAEMTESPPAVQISAAQTLTLNTCGRTTPACEGTCVGNIQLKLISLTCLWRGFLILFVCQIHGLNQDPELNFDESSTNWTVQHIAVTIRVYIISLRIGRSHICQSYCLVCVNNEQSKNTDWTEEESANTLYFSHDCEKRNRDICRDETEGKVFKSSHRLEPWSCYFHPFFVIMCHLNVTLSFCLLSHTSRHLANHPQAIITFLIAE